MKETRGKWEGERGREMDDDEEAESMKGPVNIVSLLGQTS